MLSKFIEIADTETPRTQRENVSCKVEAILFHTATDVFDCLIKGSVVLWLPYAEAQTVGCRFVDGVAFQHAGTTRTVAKS